MNATELGEYITKGAAAAVELAALYLRAAGALQSGDMAAAQAYLKTTQTHFDKAMADRDAAIAAGGYDLTDGDPKNPTA